MYHSLMNLQNILPNEIQALAYIVWLVGWLVGWLVKDRRQQLGYFAGGC